MERPAVSRESADLEKIAQLLGAALKDMQEAEARLRVFCREDKPHDHEAYRRLRAAMTTVSDAQFVALAAERGKPDADR